MVYTSVLEWLIHRFLMHRPFCGFRYPYIAHAHKHHGTFRADDSYHLQREEDKRIIHMAWWNGPALVLISVLPAVAVSWWLGKWSICLIALLVLSGYYAMYEYLHWCMHLPKARRIEKPWLFRRLNGHHILHHRYMHKNFNVVCPFADILFWTFMWRAKTHFAQVRGPSVPDVQPRP